MQEQSTEFLGFPVFLPIDSIVIGERLRTFDESKVASMAESIKHQGLITPVSVRHDEAAGTYHLVAGRHRLAAVKSLGDSTIEVRVLSPRSLLEFELVEIDENLIRIPLKGAEFDQHMARRKAIYDTLHPDATPEGSLKKATRASSAQAKGATQLQILKTIKASGIHTPSEIANALDAPRQYVSNAQYELRKKGMLTQENRLTPEAEAYISNEEVVNTGHAPSFAADTASRIGVSATTVLHSARRGQVPNQEQLAGTKYEPAKYRDALAVIYKKGDAERETLTQELIGKMLAGEDVDVIAIAEKYKNPKAVKALKERHAKKKSLAARKTEVVKAGVCPDPTAGDETPEEKPWTRHEALSDCASKVQAIRSQTTLLPDNALKELQSRLTALATWIVSVEERKS